MTSDMSQPQTVDDIWYQHFLEQRRRWVWLAQWVDNQPRAIKRSDLITVLEQLDGYPHTR